MGNLSSHNLTETQTRVLELSLHFCPSSTLKKFKCIKDAKLFVRCLALKTLYHEENIDEVAVAENTSKNILEP